jgi:hypothetical protein
MGDDLARVWSNIRGSRDENVVDLFTSNYLFGKEGREDREPPSLKSQTGMLLAVKSWLADCLVDDKKLSRLKCDRYGQFSPTLMDGVAKEIERSENLKERNERSDDDR